MTGVRTLEVGLREPRGQVPPQAAPILIRALPTRVDLELYQGDDFGLAVRVWNQDGSEADLTGFAATAQIRPEPSSWEVSGEFEPSIEDNVIRLHLPGAVSAGLPTRGVWDCQVIEPGGAVITLVAGRVLMAEEVTR